MNRPRSEVRGRPDHPSDDTTKERRSQVTPAARQFAALTATELQHLADIARITELREAELQVARLAEVCERPALGAYRNGHQPPALPPDAPPMPPPLVVDAAGLIALAGHYQDAGVEHERAARLLAVTGAWSGLPAVALADALAVIDKEHDR